MYPLHANGRIQPPKSQKEALVSQKGTPVLDSILTRKNPPAIGGEGSIIDRNVCV